MNVRPAIQPTRYNRPGGIGKGYSSGFWESVQLLPKQLPGCWLCLCVSLHRGDPEEWTDFDD